LNKNILITYYSQTGQLKSILDSLTKGFNLEEYNIDFYEIKPIKKYSYPMTSDDFFNCMPEAVNGITTEIELSEFPFNKKYDLIIMAYQVWYLSPSIPFNSFINNAEIKKFIKDKSVLTVLGVRNMWIGAHERIKGILKECKANHIGNIVFQDKGHNLLTVATVIKWLIGGNKGPYRFLPEAGVSNDDIANAILFAAPIKEWLNDSSINLQEDLLYMKAVNIRYHLMKIELNAIKIFRKFSAFILSKGDSENSKRLGRVRLFKYYLIFVIYIISPLAGSFFRLYRILNYKKSKSEVEYYKSICFNKEKMILND
jgi:hypothetical protein